jgi:transposase
MTTEGRVIPDAELARLRQEIELLRTSFKQSSQEVEFLRAEREQFLEQLRQKSREIDGLQHQLQQLLRRLFGRSAEKIDPKQMVLFEALLNQLAPATSAPAETSEPPPESESRPRASSNGHGRRRLPSDLPRQKVIHDLPEDQKPCPCCGRVRHVIGQEVSEQLDYVPARLTVIEHVRLKYACRACEENASEDGPRIVTAEKPLSPIEKGLAAPGLPSYVLVSKYSDHLPLHRLEHILQRHGIRIARSTMCDWAAQCAALLRPLYDRMADEVRQSKVIHTDDTPVEVLDRSRTQTRTGRFWVYLGDKSHPYTVFAYTPSRSRDGPMQFLKGWGRDERVYLQADAFGGYDGIYAGQAGGCVTEVACWAHARRKFYDARNSDAATSTQALAYIRLLYDVEVEAKQRAALLMNEDESQAPANGPVLEAPAVENVSANECVAAASLRSRRAELIRALRQEKSVPRLAQFKTWLESQQAHRGGPFGLPPRSPSLPKSPMGQAILYALNQWDALGVYTTDGDLAIDNNVSENALRHVAVGRKNWLFCGSDNGGNTAATLFSLIATCRRHKVDPFAYLRDVLTRLAATSINQLDAFLPDRWASPKNATVEPVAASA